jgi:hypothetical protein
MASDVTRDELAAALAATGVIIEGARLLHSVAGDVFLASVRYPGAVAEELLAHIEAGRQGAS